MAGSKYSPILSYGGLQVEPAPVARFSKERCETQRDTPYR
jgi:hypothetical protein